MKCHKCPVVQECSHVGLKKFDEEGKLVAKGCLILYAFARSWANEQPKPTVIELKPPPAEAVGLECKET